MEARRVTLEVPAVAAVVDSEVETEEAL